MLVIKFRISAPIFFIGAFILPLNKAEANILRRYRMNVTIEKLITNFDGGAILLGGLLIVVVIYLVRKFK